MSFLPLDEIIAADEDFKKKLKWGVFDPGLGDHEHVGVGDRHIL